MDGEGNVVGHPMKRQDNKSCESITGQTCISLPNIIIHKVEPKC